MLAPISEGLNRDILHTTEAADSFVSVLRDQLIHHGLLKQELQEDEPHRRRAIVRSRKRLAHAKNIARRSIRSSPREFLTGVRTHNLAVRGERELLRNQSTRRQEKAFQENPWRFAKSACSPSSQTAPTFSSGDAFTHFSELFSSTSSTYTTLPHWVHSVMPSPEISEGFNLSPITPGAIKGMLRRCKRRSAPGQDGIEYFHLKNLPTCHHFLATLYTKILLGSHQCPPSWASGKITLLHKGGDACSPSNYQPITLSSVVGKLFHKIIAARLETFCLSNNIIDSSSQKGFLCGINGTIEHIFTVTSIIEHACSNGLPLTMTFVDLRNAFGSIAHQLVADILSHLLVPPPVIRYITDVYHHLKAFVSTKHWSTPIFPITRGVFQGDTMSPIIFLMVFNPILKLVQSLSHPGFAFRILIPNSIDLPDPGSTILE